MHVTTLKLHVHVCGNIKVIHVHVHVATLKLYMYMHVATLKLHVHACGNIKVIHVRACGNIKVIHVRACGNIKVLRDNNYNFLAYTYSFTHLGLIKTQLFCNIRTHQKPLHIYKACLHTHTHNTIRLLCKTTTITQPLIVIG